MPIRCQMHVPSECSSTSASVRPRAGARTPDAAKVVKLLDNLLVVHDAAFGPGASLSPDEMWLHQQRAVLNGLLSSVGLAARKPGQNWLAELHARLTAILPSAYTKLYPHAADGVSEEELRIITAHAHQGLADVRRSNMGEPADLNRAKLLQAALAPFRHRGCVVACRPMLQYRLLVMGSIEHLVGFGIPSEEALQVASRYAPLVEVGAGTGYWTAMLRARGADIVAYDLAPPTDNLRNPYFGAGVYAEVRQGDGTTLFKNAALRLHERTLLLVWPNNADWCDNPQVAPETCPKHPPWDADCLLSYMAAGGTTVIYAGEREAVLQEQLANGAPPDCGISSSRRFQGLLSDNFDLVERVDLPSWWVQADDLTVWRRARGRGPSRRETHGEGSRTEQQRQI